MVVAGVIIDMDRQWREIQDYYLDLAEDHFPDEQPERFVFHAHHIWHGKKEYRRKKWPITARRRLLKQLAQVPRHFGLPIVAGAIDREGTRQELLSRVPNMTEKAIRFHTYSQAFIEAVRCVDSWMRKNAPNEVAILIAEESHGVESGMQVYHAGYTNPYVDPELAFASQHIVDSLMYAKKRRGPHYANRRSLCFLYKKMVHGPI